ncbi:MAG: nucleotidyltransferase [Planctomycetes bacterium]|nr:nucleotidyltransferase [Planctomycetota bacterium]
MGRFVGGAAIRVERGVASGAGRGTGGRMSTFTKMTTWSRFRQFGSNLMLTEDQRADGRTKHSGVRSCLNQWYYGVSSGASNSLLVGSWGKSTEIRPPRDIDVLFVLPDSVYTRFEARPWDANKQSELLQEVKRVLSASYPRTEMRGDGQVVVVSFDSYAVEVVPAFEERDPLFGGTTGRYRICNTKDGGSYKVTDPKAEIAHVRKSDEKTNGNTRALIRMAKKWQEHCNVPLKSFCLELLAVEFLDGWSHADKSEVYYDWMSRDFFAHLVTRAGWLSWVTVPGTGEWIGLGSEWKSRAESAHARAVKACGYERDEDPVLAGLEWRKIFGDDMPLA